MRASATAATSARPAITPRWPPTEDMIGLAMANDTPSVTAPGARGPRHRQQPARLRRADRRRASRSCSTWRPAPSPGGKVAAAHALGKPIPDGWLVDHDGRPTTDPGAFLRGRRPDADGRPQGLRPRPADRDAGRRPDRGRADATGRLLDGRRPVRCRPATARRSSPSTSAAMMPIDEFKRRVDALVPRDPRVAPGRGLGPHLPARRDRMGTAPAGPRRGDRLAGRRGASLADCPRAGHDADRYSPDEESRPCPNPLSSPASSSRCSRPPTPHDRVDEPALRQLDRPADRRRRPRPVRRRLGRRGAAAGRPRVGPARRDRLRRDRRPRPAAGRRAGHVRRAGWSIRSAGSATIGYRHFVVTPTYYVTTTTADEHLRLFGACREAADGDGA